MKWPESFSFRSIPLWLVLISGLLGSAILSFGGCTISAPEPGCLKVCAPRGDRPTSTPADELAPDPSSQKRSPPDISEGERSILISSGYTPTTFRWNGGASPGLSGNVWGSAGEGTGLGAIIVISSFDGIEIYLLQLKTDPLTAASAQPSADCSFELVSHVGDEDVRGFWPVTRAFDGSGCHNVLTPFSLRSEGNVVDLSTFPQPSYYPEY